MCWDDHKIRDLLEAQDRNLVLNIKLSRKNKDDMWHWKWEQKGISTVKSAYEILNPFSDIFRVQGNDNFWNALWKIEVLTKARNLVCRACWNLLPTYLALNR